MVVVFHLGRLAAQHVHARRGLEFARVEFDVPSVRMRCTELPLVMNDANSPLPTLDSTRLLAHAALRRAIAS